LIEGLRATRRRQMDLVCGQGPEAVQAEAELQHRRRADARCCQWALLFASLFAFLCVLLALPVLQLVLVVFLLPLLLLLVVLLPCLLFLLLRFAGLPLDHKLHVGAFPLNHHRQSYGVLILLRLLLLVPLMRLRLLRWALDQLAEPLTLALISLPLVLALLLLVLLQLQLRLLQTVRPHTWPATLPAAASAASAIPAALAPRTPVAGCRGENGVAARGPQW
jgi:hypothetical protein